jgi:predicted CXXCH cytochrome family protein
VCASCHPNVPVKTAKAVHKPVRDGACTQCHDPHGSQFAPALVRAPAELCGSCHKELTGQIEKAKYKHRPLEKGGCVTCHEPHGSVNAGLLKKDVPGLCVGCHKTENAVFVKKHLNYPVAKSRCTSCHDPHASSKLGLLSDNVHAPVAKMACAQCHESPTSARPFATKAEGLTLCRMCHADQVGKMLDRNRLHRPVVAGEACLSCHNPHASKAPKLVKGDLGNVCASCHQDTAQRHENAVSKHPPLEKDQCMSCHDPHGGDAPLMLASATDIEVCGKCHDWQRHSSHPIGDALKDPRNPNLGVSCLSCHRAHGTEYKNMNPFPETTALCTKCHEKYKR